MKNKQTHFLKSSFAMLFFVMIGYTVKFFPESLTAIDSSIQSTVRGSLPEGVTQLFKLITVVGNVKTQILIVALASLFCAVLKWKAEAYFILANGLVAAVLISGFKLLYQRPRPSISHLVHAGGFSFPSGHAMGSMLILGALLIISYQRLSSKDLQITAVIFFSILIALIGLSRVYLGVHYPSDVLAGFILGFGILHLLFPFYDQKRFEWRFQMKQD
ncbi:phosphatase PAP2 family protein [Streptococcus ictaluri]|uniref:PAP2 family protein n=1 Tax=Streptococcus ictaluri 707-05 TaxID=764299 RepID=G5K1F8_9STRE|nr:phosphatase PAP2 family protein [Streptococcus ictaluri]EHI70012.1 PAP2 family protein [Streptococcus ictaluri 707-05]